VLDIGFGEIALIFGLALVVLGPEKLPRVASQVGRWIGRARGMARQFREQLEEEVNLEETRRSRPAAVTPPPPPSPEGTSPVGTPAATIEPPAPAATPWEPAASSEPTATSSEHPTTLAPSATSEPIATSVPAAAAEASPHTGSASVEPLAEPQQPVYPDHYSHAHPTDSDGRPLPAASPEGTPADVSGQQDWIGVPTGDAAVPAGDVPSGDSRVTATDNPAQSSHAPGYASSHERGI